MNENPETKTNESVLRFFPLDKPRKSQELVITEIDNVFKQGKKIVILEAPVGSGKSAIAITLARSIPPVSEEGVGGVHIITPRKSLQDQYFEDFKSYLVLMKGRNAYPCTIDAPNRAYAAVIKAVNEGKVKPPDKNDPNCAEAPCKNDTQIYEECTEARNCPYVLAIKVANEEEIIVHNLHSFIFQSNFGAKFTKRELLIIDEAHNIENTIRGFITKKIYVSVPIKDDELKKIEASKDINDWVKFLMEARYVPEETDKDRNLKAQDKRYKSRRDEYVSKVNALEIKGSFDQGFSVEIVPEYKHTVSGNILIGMNFEFIPHSVAGAAQNLLFNYGSKVLLMSGTIYNKDVYCKSLGISLSDAHFIRIGSSFPKVNRPIYLKPKYQVNTSHAQWNDNFPKLIDIIQDIMSIFKDVKGLIHAPSYATGIMIANALNDKRVWTHDPLTFTSQLESFYDSKSNGVFISPVCQEGVDFKGDRARFQIIVRIPYPATSSKFMTAQVQDNFPWYNFQSLITFGQQIGRINRSEDDFGATFLVDDRFNKYISRNASYLPNWVKEALVWR